MPVSHINDLEEQLRQDRRLGNARRRKRRLRRLLPIALLLILVLGLYLLLRNSGGDAEDSTERPAPGSSSVTLSFVGDICLNEEMLQSFRVGADYDFSPLLRRIVPRLAAADLTVGNLEGNVVSNDEVTSYAYPPALLQALYDVGFDVLQTSNSYSIQNGIAGLSATKQIIREAGMEPLGTWDSQEDREQNGVLIREINGIRIAFLAFTKGMNNLRLPAGAEYCVNLLYSDYDTNYSKIARSAIANCVEEAKAKSPDLIVAMVHWGSEYDKEITDSQSSIAKLLFDSGVSLIIGSHSHLVGPMELKNRTVSPFGGSFVAYSLGDFISVGASSAARSGCVLSITVQKHDGSVRITNVEYAPTYSAAPDEEYGTTEYELLDTLDTISFYESGYYDRVSEDLYERLQSAVARMKEQTGLGDMQASK